MNRIFDISSHISVYALYDGILVQGIDEETRLSSIKTDKQYLNFVQNLSILISQDLFTYQENGIFSNLDQLEFIEKDLNIDPFLNVLDWSNFVLKINARGTIGFDDFYLEPSFYDKNQKIYLESMGIIGFRGENFLRIPVSQARIINICNEWNNSTPEFKNNKKNALECVYQIQKIYQRNDFDIKINEYLLSEHVVKPESLKISVVDDGRYATVYPVVDDVSEEILKTKFLNLSDVPDIYDIEEDKGRTRILLDEKQRKSLQAIKTRGFGMSGEKRNLFYRNPKVVLPEGEEYDRNIEIVGFGPRVKGIGYPQFVSVSKISSKEKWLSEDGNEHKELPDLLSQLKSHINHKNSQYIENAKTQKNKLGLLIHTNTDIIDYQECVSGNNKNWHVKIPSSLHKEYKLTKYQEEGIEWLQRLIKKDLSKGALLADDMGLGKTLQLLTFVAWCIEDHFKNIFHDDAVIYDPILIVTPRILMDNWEAELNKFFIHQGNVFRPYEILHGKILNTYKRKIDDLEKIAFGENTLDLEKIKKNRVIITNYDTVKNYEYSFAKILWSLIIVDEAQALKDHNADVTHALKALNPKFRIASTGTPIETSITNLWSILDFVYPGNELKSLKEFYELFKDLELEDEIKRSDAAELLKQKVRYNQIDGLIKRRTKKEVLNDLPKKIVKIIDCDVNQEYRELFHKIKEEKKFFGKKQSSFEPIQKLQKLTLHPFLMYDNFKNEQEWQSLVEACPKLKKMVEILKNVQKKEEKVLIFTRSIPMQMILKNVLDHVFHLNIDIVNGSTSNKKYHELGRKKVIEKFQDSSGFNMLILSPEVAGVGLTITAANHVIHYERWWNPAKENQATDRAYRMGQKKTVFVYYLIYRDVLNPHHETFDEKLHRLLGSREAMADDFLRIQPMQEQLEEQINQEIFETEDELTTLLEEPNLKFSDLEKLNGHQFEALVSIFLEKEYETVKLTPKSHDFGVDVVAMSKDSLTLVECKHSVLELRALKTVMDGLKSSWDYYRENILSKECIHKTLKLIIVMSGKIDKKMKKEASDSYIVLWGADELDALLKKHPIKLLEVNWKDKNGRSKIESFRQFL